MKNPWRIFKCWRNIGKIENLRIKKRTLRNLQMEGHTATMPLTIISR